MKREMKRNLLCSLWLKKNMIPFLEKRSSGFVFLFVGFGMEDEGAQSP